jgi:hypothetical protein
MDTIVTVNNLQRAKAMALSLYERRQAFPMKSFPYDVAVHNKNIFTSDSSALDLLQMLALTLQETADE